MHIAFYRSAFCPRCHLAKKYLFEIIAQDPEIQVEIIDVLTAPRRTWNAGIRMIPALEVKKNILSGMFLGKDDIREFIAQNKALV